MSSRGRWLSPARRLFVSTLLLGWLSLSSLGHKGDVPAVALVARETSPVRLVVLVVFDQLRGDYLQRWHDLFGEGGFRRLTDEGAWFQNCHYPYAITKTAAGHASMSTGAVPAQHGIIDNDWHERSGDVYCVASDRYQRVPYVAPPPTKEGKPGKDPGAMSPDRLRLPTVGDALKRATGGKARVVSLSFKDRSAVLLGGYHPDACYWFDTNTGDFITSNYYRGRPHAWVADYNRTRPADRWRGKEWTPVRPDLDYGRWSEVVSANGEQNFGHPISAKPKETFYQALYGTPLGNELILELTERAIDAEQLGRHSVPDLLCVSFSCNDPVGHVYGPDSQEVLDTTLRSDVLMKAFLEFLDSRVGRGRYVLALSADHGVCPLPEIALRHGKPAGRVSTRVVGAEAEDFLRQQFGDKPRTKKDKTRWVEATKEAWIYLNHRLLRARKVAAADAESALAGWLKRQPGVQTAYTRTELLQGPPADPFGQSVWRSFVSDRSGDVVVILKPYHLFTPLTKMNTTHGTPHGYDTHVPLLVYGPGIAAGPRSDRVAPQAMAAVGADALGIAAPNGSASYYPKSLSRSRVVGSYTGSVIP